MTLDVDAVIDRRHLRRKLSFWRIGALVALSLAIVAALAAGGAFNSLGKPGDHIARVTVSGMIVDDRKFLEMLKSIREDKSVKGVVLAIDSPGGTTVGGEAIFQSVRQLAEAKPTVASIGTLAASAGYMIASAADHIIARQSSIVGSIGVIFQYPQASELLAKIGVEMKEVKSSPLKAEPSPFHEAPPEAEAMLKALIDDSYNWFVDLVTERRPLSRAEVLKLADGRIFSGRQGVTLKLVDAVGGEDVALTWLQKEKGIDSELKVLDWKPKRDTPDFPFAATLWGWVTGQPVGDINQIDIKQLPAAVPRRLFLDGLLSIWHG